MVSVHLPCCGSDAGRFSALLSDGISHAHVQMNERARCCVAQ